MQPDNKAKLTRFLPTAFAIAFGVWLLFAYQTNHVTNSNSRDLVEEIAGKVSAIAHEQGKLVLYLDLTPNNDSDNDGNLNNDREQWVSAFDPAILDKLSKLNVGDDIYAKDVWRADESFKSGINHYYIVELYAP